MSLFHGIAFVDHHSAEVLQFGAEHVVERKVQEQVHFTRQHERVVRSEYGFRAEVCSALEGIAQVFIVGGGHTGLAGFRHEVDKHRPLTAKRIVGYEVVDHPTENQLVGLARKHFVRYDQMAGPPEPGCSEGIVKRVRRGRPCEPQTRRMNRCNIQTAPSTAACCGRAAV